MLKTVGIIGGFGPETTREFYGRIIEGCRMLGCPMRAPIELSSVPLPLELEESLLLRGEREAEYLPFLVEAARKLERAGADFIVMPCNTLHIFLRELRASVEVPILSIVHEVVRFLKRNRLRKKVGLLATRTTVERGLYQTYLEREYISCVVPDRAEQRRLDAAIHCLVNGDGAGTEIVVREIIESFKARKVKHIILGCSDLQLLPAVRGCGLPVRDSMSILADASVDHMTGNSPRLISDAVVLPHSLGCH